MTGCTASHVGDAALDCSRAQVNHYTFNDKVN